MADEQAQAAMAAIVGDIAHKAGDLALEHFRSLAGLSVESKGHLDLVTRADKEVEVFLITQLRQAFPDDGFFGEEGGEITSSSGRIWVIDPIDGTFNFIRGGQDWAISIGLYEKHRPAFGVIHAPARALTLMGGTSFPARRNGQPIAPLPPLNMSQAAIGLGIHPSVATKDRIELMRFISDELRISFRVCGSATASLISVALGQTDGYLSLGDSTWDVMAALPILATLGASHTIDWDRTELQEKLRFVCGSREFVALARPLLQTLSQAT